MSIQLDSFTLLVDLAQDGYEYMYVCIGLCVRISINVCIYGDTHIRAYFTRTIIFQCIFPVAALSPQGFGVLSATSLL